MKKNSYFYRTQKGLNQSIIATISAQKNEPEWMLNFRLKALGYFEQKPLPSWGADLTDLNSDDIYYYVRPTEKKESSWDNVPPSIKETFERLGIPQAEQKYLAGVGAQFESEVIYKKLREQWAHKGVIFLDTDSALHEYPDLFRRYFATVIPSSDNKFAALNSAVWSGGSFVYIPPGVIVDQPLQAYFRIDSERMGQFERTLIIADRNSFVHYVEGCSAPVYSANSLHSAVVEIIALPGSHVRYTTIQNWAPNVYNLVTKRAIAHEKATVEWVDGNFGSKVTMKYPAIILKGSHAKGRVISIAVAHENQHQDTGAKIVHCAPYTSSHVIAKSLSRSGGRASYRGLVKVTPAACDIQSKVECEALLLDGQSQSDTYPTLDIKGERAQLEHEATVYWLSAEHVWYLQSRGITAAHARGLIATGFIDVFTQELPMEYAVEINRLIALEMEGSIG